MKFSEHVLTFLQQLALPFSPPPGIEVLTPFETADAAAVCAKFYHSFYDDNHPRKMIIGINPGRHGGGVTGIPFTDPFQLRKACNIPNRLTSQRELSSTFVYEVIEAYGGASSFYKRFYITAVSPLGFTRMAKNVNYYDDKQLLLQVKDFAVLCMQKQLRFGIDRSVAFCLGHGKNFTFLSRLNEEFSFFERLVPLAHPHFIMQYKLRSKADYIQAYLADLKCPGQAT